MRTLLFYLAMTAAALAQSQAVYINPASPPPTNYVAVSTGIPSTNGAPAYVWQAQSGGGSNPGYATNAGYATNSAFSTNSGYASTSGYATNSGYSTNSGSAVSATYSSTAGYSTNSGFATNSSNLGSGTYIPYLTAGVPGAATTAEMAAALTGGSGTLNLSGYTLSLASSQIPNNASNTTGTATHANNLGTGTYIPYLVSGAPQALVIGAGLSLTTGTLTATGGGVTWPLISTDGTIDIGDTAPGTGTAFNLNTDGTLYLSSSIFPISGPVWANPNGRLIYDQYNEQAISTVSDSINTDSTTTIIADPDDGAASINGSLFVRETLQLQSFGGSTVFQANNDGTIELNGNQLNTTGGLARLTASDGTADGSIAFLGTTDDGNNSVAIGEGAESGAGGGAVGNSATASSGGGAVGNGASASFGGAVGNGASASFGGAVGYYASASNGGAVGNSASESSGGGAVGNAASANFGGAVGNGATANNGGAVGNSARESNGGGAVGNGASATTGFAGGQATTETGGGANFCGGTYAGTGLAIAGNEVANVSGQITGPLPGYTVSTLPSGVIGQCAYVTDALTPTFGTPLVGGGSTVAKAFFNGINWINE